MLAAPFALSSSYLLLLLVAGGARRACGPPTGTDEQVAPVARLRFLILIPAHDEEEVLGETLDVLGSVTRDHPFVRTVVIADNCSDRTADVALAEGAEVLVRAEPERRGKGHALAWALAQLDPDLPDFDAVVVLDADCHASNNLLVAIERAFGRGASAAQVAYVVANPDESVTAALRWAAFGLQHVVRPAGRAALGMSCGIFGTGFALSCEVLARHPWRAFGLSEDQEYHLALVEAGERVTFVPEAFVASPMPTTLRASRQQNLRWEGGRRSLIMRCTPRLVTSAIRRRDLRLLVLGLEPLVPPQSLHALMTAVVASLTLMTRASGARRLAAFSAAGQVGYVVGGLYLAGAPATVYRAMALAPAFAVWKAGLQLRVLLGGGPSEWIATRTRASS